MKKKTIHSMIGGAMFGGVASVLSLAAVPAFAGSFDRAAVAPDLGVEVFTREVAEDKVGKRLFSAPYSSAVIGNVDIYDTFPYVESRYFVIVSDPEWDRLVITATGSGRVTEYHGDDLIGVLSAPRGLTVDGENRVYVCDTENNRLLVLQAEPEFDRLGLRLITTVEDLSRPYDVAVSDNGTPTTWADDRVYIAEAGANRVSKFEVSGNDLSLVSRLGGLGSGVGRFAGPLALAVGFAEGAGTEQVYVADSHNRRIVLLEDDGRSLQWISAVGHDASSVTGLDVDQWGQLYSVSPQDGTVTKWTPNLEPLARLQTPARPRSFHVPFVTTTDHRSGTVTRSGEGRGLLVEDWKHDSGIRAWSLGLELSDLGVSPNPSSPSAEVGLQFQLTDPALVVGRLERVDDGTIVAEKEFGVLLSGAQSLELEETDFLESADASAEYRFVVEASSTYEGGPTVVASSDVSLDRDLHASGRPTFLGNSPNPFPGTTTFRLQLPPAEGTATVRVFDLAGRLVDEIAAEHSGGRVDLEWDGRDSSGRESNSGIYFYRVLAADREWEGRMVRLK